MQQEACSQSHADTLAIYSGSSAELGSYETMVYYLYMDTGMQFTIPA